MFYLTTHSTHFYGYMTSDIWLRTILIVRKETRCRHIGYCYRLTANVLLYAPSHRQDNTYHGLCYTSHGALAGTRNVLKASWKLTILVSTGLLVGIHKRIKKFVVGLQGYLITQVQMESSKTRVHFPGLEYPYKWDSNNVPTGSKFVTLTTTPRRPLLNDCYSFNQSKPLVYNE